jgi:hypothetical protein
MNTVIEWLRSPEGEDWSRDRASRPPGETSRVMVTPWRATGPLSAGSDPCGRPAIAIGTSTGESA